MYDNGNYDLFKENLGNTNWVNIIDNENIDEAASLLTSTIINTASTCILNKNVTIRPSDAPWMNNQIRKLIRKRKQLHRRAKRTDNPYHWSQFRKIRNKCLNLINKTKDYYHTKLINKLNDDSLNIKQWWKISKYFMSCSSKSTPHSLALNNQIYNDPDDVTNIFPLR